MTTKELSKQVRAAQKEFNKWPKRKQRGMIADLRSLALWLKGK